MKYLLLIPFFSVLNSIAGVSFYFNMPSQRHHNHESYSYVIPGTVMTYSQQIPQRICTNVFRNGFLTQECVIQYVQVPSQPYTSPNINGPLLHNEQQPGSNSYLHNERKPHIEGYPGYPRHYFYNGR